MNKKWSVKGLCAKLEKSIILLFKLLLYGGCFAAFFLLLSIENYQILGISRTAAVTMLTYVLMAYLLSGIYGKYDVGVRKSRPIVYSLVLAIWFADIVTYVMLAIMNTNEANNELLQTGHLGNLFFVMLVQMAGYLAGAMLIQLLLINLLTYAGNAFYFWINEPENCLLITAQGVSTRRVQAALGQFKKRYRIMKTVCYDSRGLREDIRQADAVFLYDVPVRERAEIMTYCYKKMISTYYNPEISDVLEQSAKQLQFDDLSFYASEFKGMTFEQRIGKRLMDIVISFLLLLILSPVLLISALCIKCQDGGSVLFKQKRATIHGRVFVIYKFRTMREHVENYSATADDDRVTGVGRFLRKYRIDELPQLLNILKGDMSLVGPRPEMLENVESYTKDMPEFKYRLRVKAGLTGYAQIIGKYNTSSRDKLILDLMYIENYSLLKDIQLLFQTVLVLLRAEESTEAFETRKEDEQ